VLIRPEVLAERQFRLYGRVRTRVRSPHAFVAISVFALLAFVFHLACTTRYTERAQVAGYLVPDAGIVRIHAPRRGIVDEIFVVQGQSVRRGDPLLRIASERRHDAERTQSDALADNLRRRADELARQDALGERRMRTELARLASERKRLVDEAGIARAQAADQERWLSLARERLGRFREAASRGSVARAELLRLENEVVAGEIQRKTLERTLVSLRAEIESTALAARDVAAELDARRSSLALARLEVESTALENESARAELIVAPATGRIVTLAAPPRSAVDSGRELVVIAPDGDGVRADLFVPASAIGLVRPGASVSIRYDAFPYQEHGVFAARVREIDQFVFDLRDIDVELQVRGAVFRVVASPARQSVETAHGAVALRPGMTLRADIALRELRVIDWILEPVLRWRAAPFGT
jgi:membrane fusion protein